MSLDARATRILLAALRYYSQRLGREAAAALAAARAGADLDAAERALRRDDYAGAMEALFPAEARASLQSALNVSAIRVMLASAARTLKNDVPAVLSTTLEGPTQAVIAAIQTLDLQRVAPLVRGSENAVRSVLTIGLQEGMNPRDVARWARDGIGLSEYDIELAQTFEAQLRGAPRDALARTLRDARHDATLRAAALGEKSPSEALIVKMRERYVQGLRNWRAETFTRTTTLDALKQGQKAAWLDAADAAGVEQDELDKTWITTLDGRERPAHHDAHGTTVGIHERFPVDGGVDVPGENVYNCRCAMTVRLRPRTRKAANAFFRSRAARFEAERAAAQ